MADARGTAGGGEARRVLVVEDEVAIAMLVEDMLQDLGYAILGPVGRLAEAIELARRERFDAALVDVNIAGEPIYPLVELLAERGIAFVFTTGYGSDGIEAPWKDRPVLPKPFSQDDLGATLARAIAAA